MISSNEMDLYQDGSFFLLHQEGRFDVKATGRFLFLVLLFGGIIGKVSEIHSWQATRGISQLYRKVMSLLFTIQYRDATKCNPCGNVWLDQ